MSLSGRYLLIIIPAIMINILLVDADHVSAEEPTAYGPHWVSIEPQAREEFEFFIYITGLNSSNMEYISLNINGEDHSLKEFSRANGEYYNGTLYHSTLTLDRGGIFRYNVTVEIDGTIFNIYRGEIEIFESGSDADDDTILGLPRWWCVVSVLIGTVFIIFLTWAYFKGRSIQRVDMKNDLTGMACSSCGTSIDNDDPKCSKCGSLFDDVEYICGKCGKNVTHGSRTCSHCGSRLKDLGQDIHENNDKDIEKLDGFIDMTGKVKCHYCDGIISSSDKRCPACKKIL